ncbi:hypothetical protein [Sedimentitalea sp. HM32M-2]|uniref:hypothetical protein n=1 Tax=Sedimentitalea sp. HM32M-2 TaxID=3351566 RepID=UPI0036D21F67
MPAPVTNTPTDTPTGPDLVPDLVPGLNRLRHGRAAGAIADRVDLAPGLALIADPALRATGRWRSPAGRLLELEIETGGRGDWMALHLALATPDLAPAAFFGFACTGLAPQMQLIRACLRSGRADGGFVDCFFDRHILTAPEPAAHVDALHLPTQPEVPEDAPWRELLLFLPPEPVRWHLHDLRVFAA